MLKIVKLISSLLLVNTLLQANEQKEEMVSKFKQQSKTITPLSITKFEMMDKNGNVKIINLKGKKL